MNRRIQGTEHEYTLYCKKMSDKGLDPHSLGLELIRDSDLHSAGEWVTNGSRCYYDVGHFEVSTPECSNPFDLVVWEKAGEKMLDWVRKVMEEKYVGRGRKIWAFKNNTSPDGTSYGSHENYCVDRSLNFPAKYVKELVPHLTTRLVYTGSGDILDGKYVLSPMAYMTSTVVSGETMHDTGVLNTRDEPHAGDQYRRLHVIVGDALMNETAILLRHFTTSAILQLMEEDALDDVPKLDHAVEDMWHNVERTRPDEWKVRVDGKVSSPIDVQRYYLGKVETIVETDEERRVLKLWEEVLSDLESKRSRRAARRVEWLDRWFAIQEAVEEKAGTDMEMVAAKQYSEIGDGRGIFYRRQRDGLIERQVSDEAILRAVREPPQDTRAVLRAQLCDRFNVDSVDWSVVVVNDDGRRRIELPDPYATELEETHAPTAG
jgi:proteasome accessory factor A